MTRPPTRFALTLVALFVAGCASEEDAVFEDISPSEALPSGGTTEVQPEEAVAATELCDAADYRGLIGSNVAATVFPQSDTLRVYSVNDIVTRDFIPQRTNVVHQDNGNITQVFCG